MANVSSPSVFLGDVKTLNAETRFVPHTQVTDDILIEQIKVRVDLFNQMVGQVYTMMLQEQITALRERVRYLERGGNLIDVQDLQSASLEVIEEQIDLRIVLAQQTSLVSRRNGMLQEAGALLDKLYAPEHIAMLWQVMEATLSEHLPIVQPGED